MKQSWENWIGSILFLAIGFFLLLHLNYVLRPHKSWRRVYPGYYAEAKDSLDVVSIGTSAALWYIDPPHLWESCGITSYTLGTADAPFESFRYLIEEAEKTQNPDLLIIDARGILITHNDNEKFEQIVHIITDSMNHDIPRLQVIQQEVPVLTDRLDYIWEMNFYHDNWETLTVKDWAYWDNQEALPLKVPAIVMRVKPLNTLKPDGDVKVSPQPLDAGIQEDLTDLLEYCQRLDTPVLFLETPYRRPARYDGMSQTLESLVKSYGLDYLDLNDVADEIGLDIDTDFYNTRHTNMWGAWKVTEYLGKWLKQHYTINEKHSEAVTEDWNRAADLENQMVTAYMDASQKDTVDSELIDDGEDSGE